MYKAIFLILWEERERETLTRSKPVSRAQVQEAAVAGRFRVQTLLAGEAIMETFMHHPTPPSPNKKLFLLHGYIGVDWLD